MGTNLTDFLRKQQDQDAQGNIDRDAVRDEWLRELDWFGKQVQEWLREPIHQGLLHVESGQVRLQEELLGAYDAPSWEIRAGKRRISVEPVGRIIVGAIGRVDLVYGPRKVILVRAGPGQWRVAGPRGRGPDSELKGETFSEAIRLLLE